VELFFQVALGANLIGTKDPNNRTDMAYLFYTPFCQMFVSSDSLQRAWARHFLRDDQSFVWGLDLKTDLSRLASCYAARPDEEKEQGLMRLAPTPPQNDAESLTAQLWDRHFGTGWRRGDTQPKNRNREEDNELMYLINRTASTPPLRPNLMDFDPAESEFVTIERRVSRRKGNWRIVPKDTP
jgi:hypothetical protein